MDKAVSFNLYYYVSPFVVLALVLSWIPQYCHPQVPDYRVLISPPNYNLFCYVKQFEPEPPEIRLVNEFAEIMRNMRPIAVSASGTASGTSLSAYNGGLQDIFDGKKS